jgi:hypothetical protein
VEMHTKQERCIAKEINTISSLSYIGRVQKVLDLSSITKNVWFNIAQLIKSYDYYVRTSAPVAGIDRDMI